jgi:Xaa-Pro aminopeptidase
MDFPLRRQKVIKLLSQLNLHALVFFQPQNLRYLCGFTGSDGVVVVSDEQLVFLTDSRYTTQAKEQVTADGIKEYSNKTDAVVEHLKEMQSTRIGFEASLSVGVFEELQAKGSSAWHWQCLKDNLQTLRLHKSADEIHSITTATDLNHEGFVDVLEMIKPGVREDEIALALEYTLRELGAEEKAFDIIVASGERGALPHGIASDKIIQNGDLVTIDFGCRVAGYFSDETVTIAVGDISKELRTIFDTVFEAHNRAIRAVVPGIALTELDNIARDHIKSSGYGEYFGHGLGHGVGLEVHEAPVVSPRSTLLAEEGMVFTIEPGIYVPGTGGVRIEDMVLVTSDGCRVLTKIPKMFCNILLN